MEDVKDVAATIILVLMQTFGDTITKNVINSLVKSTTFINCHRIM